MSSYQKQKEKIRSEAIDWQNSFADTDHSWGEMSITQGYFERQGKRYGLMKEFRENGIC